MVNRTEVQHVRKLHCPNPGHHPLGPGHSFHKDRTVPRLPVSLIGASEILAYEFMGVRTTIPEAI